MKFKELVASDLSRPAVALFWGPNCGPCMRLKPKLREICSEHDIDLHEFNATEEIEAVRELVLRGVPAVVSITPDFMDNVARLVFMGDQPAAVIREKLAQHGVMKP